MSESSRSLMSPSFASTGETISKKLKREGRLLTSHVENKKIRVLYLQPGTRTFAGIERVVDEICTELATNHGDLFIVDVLRVSKHASYPPEPRKYNSIMRPVTSRWALVKTFRRVVQDQPYDLIVVPQVEPTVIFWLSRFGLKQNITMHLHGNPSRECGHWKARIMFFLMRHLVLRRISSVFGTSPRQLKAFKDQFGCNKPMFWVPNPVRTFDHPSRDDKPKPGIITLVNVGRYDYQKGQDILIDAFAKLWARRKNVRLVLVGHGSGKEALAAQIRRLGLSGVVQMEYQPGNPQRALFTSDLFVATSRWEGWSLAICEALRCGLPVISVDCEFGPSDILVDPRLGRLVPPGNREALLEAMDYYCDNLVTEKAFADFRRENIDQYSVEKAAKIHATAILRTIQ